MKEFIKENLDKIIMVLLFLILLQVYVSHADNKTIENICWLSFGGVLTILGVKRNSQTINAETVESASSSIGSDKNVSDVSNDAT
jgi:c-di-AMP phosphodiesterase-like protein